VTAVVTSFILAVPAAQADGTSLRLADGQAAASSSAANDGELERAGRKPHCTSARRAVGFYLRAAWRWQELSFQPRLRVPDRGRSCRHARAGAKRLRLEARRAHLVYRLWLATPKLAGETPWHTSNANLVNRNLYRLAVCETGGINHGVPLWTHTNSTYVGALGFKWSTWRSWRWRVRPLPPADGAQASPAEQLAVGRALVREFGNYSSWPSCHRRLGLP